MPYSIRKTKSGKYQVVKKDDGKVMGTHSSKKDAWSQIVAIKANETKKGDK